MKKYTYYPGCSLEETCKPYDMSVRAVFEKLDIELNDIEDWNCCGATLSLGVNEKSAAYLSARNLAIADKAGNDIAVPCSACYTSLRKAEKTMKGQPDIAAAVSKELKEENLEYTGKAKIRHILDILYSDLRGEIKNKTEKKQENIRIACYYGCQITRPDGFDHSERPETMDRLMEDIGAVPVDFMAKTKCCAGMLMQTKENAALPMVAEVLQSAKRAGAGIIVTACPLCMMNLESYQSKLSGKYKKDLKIPVMYLTQIIGLALGIDGKALGIPGNFVDPGKELEKISGGAADA
ncbi:MAG: CoB--CoM heterodisulfide reductase iron-sulfur subunit B family protein [Candidatus Goldiibacteriota bacterium]